nr:retrovirus-related Pol polyprotein from transposon TNT 1-94 [Tanacetum cinerariifolium]
MALTAYIDADHASCQDTRRSTSGSEQFLGNKLVSWSSKKQQSTAISTTEAEYIVMSGTPGPSTLTFAVTSFKSKLREAWLNSTSCRRITRLRTYSPKHYHDNDTMADMTTPTGQPPTMAPPVRTNNQILPRITWVQTGCLKFNAKEIMADMTAPTGQAPTMAPPVRTND